MDFFDNKNRVQIIRYFVLVASFVLLFINFYRSYSVNRVNYLGIISNCCLILTMILSIKQVDNAKKKP
jgi:hypothetical protein